MTKLLAITKTIRLELRQIKIDYHSSYPRLKCLRLDFFENYSDVKKLFTKEPVAHPHEFLHHVRYKGEKYPTIFYCRPVLVKDVMKIIMPLIQQDKPDAIQDVRDWCITTYGQGADLQWIVSWSGTSRMEYDRCVTTCDRWFKISQETLDKILAMLPADLQQKLESIQ